MKNIIKTFSAILAAAVLLVLSGCEEDSHIYEGPNYVELPVAQESFVLPYHATEIDTLRIKTQIIGAHEQSNKAVGFEIVASQTSAEAGVHYRLLSPGTFEIPANSSFGYIDVLVLGDGFAPGEAVNLLIQLNEADLPVSPNYSEVEVNISKASRPVLQFGLEEGAPERVTEGDTLDVLLRLNSAAPTDLTIDYRVYGSAAENLDFTLSSPLTGSVTINAGSLLPGTSQGGQPFRLIVADDNLRETDTLFFEILDVQAASGQEEDEVVAGATFVLPFMDEDKSIVFTEEIVRFSSQGLGTQLYTVKMANASDESVTIDYEIQNGTPNVDYEDILGGQLTLQPGQTENSIVLNLLEGATQPKAEALKIVLTGVTSLDEEPEIGAVNEVILEFSGE